jgi:hypothetical protein
MWQDYSIGIVNILFSIGLIPSILSKNKPHIYTSLLTCSCLIVLSYTMFTLNLYMSTTVTAITAFGWGILLVQGIIRKRNDP